MKKIITSWSLVAGFCMTLTSCSFFELESPIDPNNPSLASVSNNATRNQIQNLVTGLENRHRNYVFTVATLYGSMGREIWYLNGSDPRWQTDWLGMNGRTANVNMFGYLNTYIQPYQAILQGNVLLSAAANSSVLSDAEKNAVSGFTKTIQAYQYMILANGQYENGIRMDVSDPLNPGPFVSYPQALEAIKALLDSGFQELTAAGTGNFPLRLTSGFTGTGFGTNQALAQMNRALAARLAAYRKDWQGVITALSGSFYDPNGNIDRGPSHTWGAPPDAFNPLYFVPNAATNTMVVVHPSVLKDTLTGDNRVRNKFFQRSTAVLVTSDGTPLSGNFQDKRFPSNSSEIKFIRNEELMLLAAEAHAQLGNASQAVESIDKVRTLAGVGAYTGATTTDALINEILFQRRYSLWFEPWGHRWVDLRRYNRLNATEVDIASDRGSIFTQLARPQAEINWDLYVGN
jgi:hypothetical protein